MIGVSQSLKEDKKRWVTKLSLYQGCHHADDRQDIEGCEGDEYGTGAGIKATSAGTRLVFGLSHDGIEGRVTKGRINVQTLRFLYTDGWPGRPTT